MRRGRLKATPRPMRLILQNASAIWCFQMLRDGLRSPLSRSGDNPEACAEADAKFGCRWGLLRRMLLDATPLQDQAAARGCERTAETG